MARRARDLPHSRDGEVEIRLTRREIARRDHVGFWHRRPGSDWIGLPADDEQLVRTLLRDALEANARE